MILTIPQMILTIPQMILTILAVSILEPDEGSKIRSKEGSKIGAKEGSKIGAPASDADPNHPNPDDPNHPPDDPNHPNPDDPNPTSESLPFLPQSWLPSAWRRCKGFRTISWNSVPLPWPQWLAAWSLIQQVFSGYEPQMAPVCSRTRLGTHQWQCWASVGNEGHHHWEAGKKWPRRGAATTHHVSVRPGKSVCETERRLTNLQIPWQLVNIILVLVRTV